ncbi:hypothetical protein [Curtobacterium sp. MCBA15_004]|uniref:hypothetical protein n=1 Tax=Curtobacterium sp. MCBA15_004 TaxID=1898733 RepID=UPI0008DE14CF|nr:hypothetical protein [Curtobacterium sp. MCBA15_004]WIA95835.1 hypothetical protein QOL16_12020 [Curtobacterium sp. MCBA15_004]
MTTTTRPSTAVEHADEARRILSFVRADVLGSTDHAEYTAVYARDPQAVAAVAAAHIALAQYEEQRTANLIAADTTDLLRNPYEVGTAEYAAYWKAHTAALAERLAVQR